MKKVRDLLVDSNLYLSAPSDFNDPYDFQAHFSLASDPVERRHNFEKTAKDVLRNNPNILPHVHGRRHKLNALVHIAMQKSIEQPEEANATYNRIRDLHGVSCFSEDPRNLLMWSHYAVGHTGVCLQFDVAQDPGVLMLAHRVIYHDYLAHLQWPRDKNRIVDDVILRKGRIWECEREVRYISGTTVRNSIAFDGRAVSGLILGSRFPDELKPTLRSLLDERSKRGLPPPKMYKAERRVDSYGVYLRRTKVV